ncbi:MAG TPA: HAMP domain-containing sensor histidine kinase [Acidimicrobiales bacterium]|nr:HAMP domain-containing sensor histidine kinase [Acidimicrobiales bacterium]
MPQGLRFLESTRARVLVGALVLLAATIVLSIVVDRALLLGRLDERIDEELAQEVDEFERVARGADPETGERYGGDLRAAFDAFFARNVPGPDEVFLAMLGDDPYLRSASSPYAVEELPGLLSQWSATADPGYRDDPTPVGELRSLVVPVVAAEGQRTGTFVVGRFPGPERAEVDDTIRTTALVGLVAFLFAAAAAWAIAGRVLAPLHHLATAAASIREDSLEHRIAVEGSGELAELTRTFNAMLDRVQRAFATQRAFLDDAGHELRTPITVIRGHLELADVDEPLPESTREIVFDELDRMARIVDDLLLIAKAERPDFVVPAPVDVGDLTQEILDKARPLGARSWAADVDAVVVAELDRDRITQAWMNLVRNAVQHTADGDRITVFSAIVDRQLELGVQDTGEGVDEEDRSRVFDRFGRGGSARRTRSDGAGLGLAIARAIAEAHGGRVELRDTPGGGATFVLCLPAPPDITPEPSASTGEPTPAAEEQPWPAS